MRYAYTQYLSADGANDGGVLWLVDVNEVWDNWSKNVKVPYFLERKTFRIFSSDDTNLNINLEQPSDA